MMLQRELLPMSIQAQLTNNKLLADAAGHGVVGLEGVQFTDDRGDSLDSADQVRECAARMMHPKAVSVLQSLPEDVKWTTVELPYDLSIGLDTLTPHPNTPDGDAAYAALPTSLSGKPLLRNRLYADFIVDKLPPESWHRFRIRFANNRGWSEWSQPSSPCCVYADWPNVITTGPEYVADSPFAIYLSWPEPDGNGSAVTGYRLQRKRLRFKPMDPEPHPDDSDSEPEQGGNWEEDWQSIPDLPATECRYLGRANVVTDFRR